MWNTNSLVQVWTRIIVYIFIDNNYYIMSASIVCVCVCVEVNNGNKSDSMKKIEKQSI